MAHFLTHCQDCEKLLGMRFEPINSWLDECFRYFGPRHRKVRHHCEGVEEVMKKWGMAGAKAAVVHIVRDTGHLPFKKDYENGEVDVLGIGTYAPYFFEYGTPTYSEKEFGQLKSVVDSCWEQWMEWEKKRSDKDKS